MVNRSYTNNQQTMASFFLTARKGNHYLNGKLKRALERPKCIDTSLIDHYIDCAFGYKGAGKFSMRINKLFDDVITENDVLTLPPTEVANTALNGDNYIELIPKRDGNGSRSVLHAHAKNGNDEIIIGGTEPGGHAKVFGGNGNDIIANYSVNTEAEVIGGKGRDMFVSTGALTIVKDYTPGEDVIYFGTRTVGFTRRKDRIHSTVTQGNIIYYYKNDFAPVMVLRGMAEPSEVKIADESFFFNDIFANN